MRNRHNRRRQRGLTLLEAMLGAAILAILFLGTLLTLTTFVHENNLTAIEITANNAMRSQIEEVYAVARDNADRDETGNMAKGVLFYYASRFAGETIPIGPAGARVPRVEIGSANGFTGAFLAYNFAVPEPGESLHDASGGVRGLVPSDRGVGRMVIWLDERTVTPFTEDPNWNVMWRDLGLGGGEQAAGFDMNGDGVVDNMLADGSGFRPVMTMAALQNPAETDFEAVPVDITITYFNNNRHELPIYTVARRIVIR